MMCWMKIKVVMAVVCAATVMGGGVTVRGLLAGEPANADPAFEKFFGPQTDWPRYRGPMGNGVTAEKGLPTKWSKTENILWAVDIPLGTYPSRPYSSPIVYKDKVFIQLSNIQPAEHRLACFNKSDGKNLWVTKIDLGGGVGIGPKTHSDDYSYDSPTPCTDGEFVYVAYASGVVAAVDYTGKVIWRQEIKNNIGYEGMCNSPVLYKDLVVVICTANGDNGGAQGVTVAFDRKTGAVKYRMPNGGRYLDNSPVPALLRDGPVILFNTRAQIEGINPETGAISWFASQPKIDRHVSASVGVGDGIAYSGRADLAGIGGAALPLDVLAGAKGDVTSKVKWTWKIPNSKCDPGRDQVMPGCSPVISGGYVYDLANWDTVSCIEAASGKVMYIETLPPAPGEKAGGYWGSPKHYSGWGNNSFATADGLIYFVSAERSYVLKAGPKFEVAGINDLNDGNFSRAVKSYDYNSDKSFAYNSAAVSEGKIFVHGHNKLWCIGK
jgi:outer membrane protein assembly factor BamB